MNYVNIFYRNISFLVSTQIICFSSALWCGEYEGTLFDESIQDALFAIIDGRRQEPIFDFIEANKNAIDLNRPNNKGIYPLNLAIDQALSRTKRLNVIIELKSQGAQLDPSPLAHEIMWSNIIYYAIARNKTYGVEFFLKEFPPTDALLAYASHQLFRAHESDAGICREIYKLLLANGAKSLDDAWFIEHEPIKNHHAMIVPKRKKKKPCIIQ